MYTIVTKKEGKRVWYKVAFIQSTLLGPQEVWSGGWAESEQEAIALVRSPAPWIGKHLNNETTNRNSVKQSPVEYSVRKERQLTIIDYMFDGRPMSIAVGDPVTSESIEWLKDKVEESKREIEMHRAQIAVIEKFIADQRAP